MAASYYLALGPSGAQDARPDAPFGQMHTHNGAEAGQSFASGANLLPNTRVSDLAQESAVTFVTKVRDHNHEFGADKQSLCPPVTIHRTQAAAALPAIPVAPTINY